MSEPPPAEQVPEPPLAEHTFLYASISDVQASISANDSKASATLLTHGLLFTGTLTLVTRLGGIYHRATLAEKLFGLVALAFMLAMFLLSLFFVLKALLPYRPERLEAKMKGRYPGAFFPLADVLKLEDPHGEMMERLERIADPVTTTAELAAERLKLADIRNYEVGATKLGHLFLRVELAAAGLFLIAVAIPAL